MQIAASPDALDLVTPLKMDAHARPRHSAWMHERDTEPTEAMRDDAKHSTLAANQHTHAFTSLTPELSGVPEARPLERIVRLDGATRCELPQAPMLLLTGRH